MRTASLIPMLCASLLCGASLPAQKVVVLHGDASVSNTWTLAHQLGQITPAKGALVVALQGSEEGQAALADADVVISVARGEHSDETGNRMRLPDVSVANAEAAIPRLVAVFGDGINDHITTQDGEPTDRTVINLVYQPNNVPNSRMNRWNRELVVEIMLELGMLAEHPGTSAFLPPNSRTTFALYDAEGIDAPGPPRVERIVNGLGENAALLHVCGEDVRDGILADDSIKSTVFPGGSGTGIANGLADSGREQLTAFIERGGGYLGICAGAYLATPRGNVFLSIVGTNYAMPWQKGIGQVEVELSEEGQTILGEEFATFQTLYENGPVLVHEDGLVPEGDFADVEVWAWFRSAVTNPNGEPSSEMIDTPAIVASTHGNGRVLIISPHPETREELDPMMQRAVQWTAGR